MAKRHVQQTSTVSLGPPRGWGRPRPWFCLAARTNAEDEGVGDGQQVVEGEGQGGGGGGEQHHEAAGGGGHQGVQPQLYQQRRYHHAAPDAQQPCTAPPPGGSASCGSGVVWGCRVPQARFLLPIEAPPRQA